MLKLNQIGFIHIDWLLFRLPLHLPLTTLEQLKRLNHSQNRRSRRLEELEQMFSYLHSTIVSEYLTEDNHFLVQRKVKKLKTTINVLCL